MSEGLYRVRLLLLLTSAAKAKALIACYCSNYNGAAVAAAAAHIALKNSNMFKKFNVNKVLTTTSKGQLISE